jgi:hypothetical protein
MSADLTGYLRAVRLYTERARAIYAAAIEEPYTPPASDDEAITRAGEAMVEFARALVEMHEPPPNPADFGVRETTPQQEATMDSQRFTAESSVGALAAQDADAPDDGATAAQRRYNRAGTRSVACAAVNRLGRVPGARLAAVSGDHHISGRPHTRSGDI